MLFFYIFPPFRNNLLNNTTKILIIKNFLDFLKVIRTLDIVGISSAHKIHVAFWNGSSIWIFNNCQFFKTQTTSFYMFLLIFLSLATAMMAGICSNTHFNMSKKLFHRVVQSTIAISFCPISFSLSEKKRLPVFQSNNLTN